jgi:hypothetical protein
MRGHPGNGRRNLCYPSVTEFETEDSRRAGGPQRDFGLGWHDSRRRDAHRVTWIEPTGELVAVGIAVATDGLPLVMGTSNSSLTGTSYTSRDTNAPALSLTGSGSQGGDATLGRSRALV